MKTLRLYPTDPIYELAWPLSNPDINLNSPACEIFTDFCRVKPLIIEAITPVDEAQNLMKRAHVRMKLVIDQSGHFSGLVSLDDLQAQEIMKKLAEGATKEDLTVTDFMRRRDQLKAFDYTDIKRSSVGDIVISLEHSGQQHCLVVDKCTHQIRGVISASDITRKLKLPIDIGTESTFSNIFSVLHH